MCGRFEGKKTRSLWAVLLGTALSFVTTPAAAQDLPEEIVRLIETHVMESGSQAEEIMEYFTDLMARPLDITTASREELEAFPLLTPFMVESLLDYRAEFGSPASLAELSLIDGFTPEAVQLMQPFILLGSATGARPSPKTRISGRLQLRTGMSFKTHEGPLQEALPLSVLTKYRMSVGQHIRAGFTLESDAGETTFPDFWSCYLAVEDVSLMKRRKLHLERLVLGDFSVRAGQGLVLWNSFSLSGLSSPQAAVRRPMGVTPYSSTDENRYYHGAGINLTLPEGLRLTCFYSNNGKDAVIEDGYFVTMPDDGLHDSQRDLAARNALREEVTGGTLQWTGSHVSVGLNAAAYRYDHQDGRRTAYYNAHLRYNGWWHNISADARLSFRGIRAFAEVAVDKDWHPAIIAGAVFPVPGEVEVAVLYRYYCKDYIATHSGAYSRTATNNEHGVASSVLWTPRQSMKLYGYLDFTHFPFARYGVRDPSQAVKATLDFSWKSKGGHSLFSRLRAAYDNGRNTRQLRARIEYGLWKERESGLALSTRLEGCLSESLSGLCFQEISYRTVSGRLQAVVRGTLFYAPDWDSRIYSYERDVAGAFSVPAYYGKGWSVCAYISYKPLKWLQISLKASYTKYSDPLRDKVFCRMQLSLPF